MTNFDLEKLLSENYCDTFESLETTDKERFYQLYKEPKKSPAAKRKVYLRVALAMLLVAAIGTIGAGAADMTIREKLAARAEKDNVHFTQEELDEVANTISSTGAFPNGREFPEIGENENGQKYGDIQYKLDLFPIGGTDLNGNYIEGYCYSDDFWSNTYPDSEKYDDVLVWVVDRDNGKVRNWIYVFDEDGITILGKSVTALQKDRDELIEKDIHTQFITNEQLETGLYDKYIYDGYDADEYEAMVQERIESLK